MFLSQTFMLFFLVILKTTESGAFLLNDHANASVGHPDNGNYNIYTKMDALERSSQNLETIVREKTTHLDTLMRQVLLTVTEMDAKLESSNMTFEIEKIKFLIKNSLENPVGFTTKLQVFDNGTSMIIKGYEILYNQGNAYNGTVFKCPSPGLYLFQVSIITSVQNSGVWIYKNSQPQTLVYSGASPQNNGTSVSAATWLDTGDLVHLRSQSGSLRLDSNCQNKLVFFSDSHLKTQIFSSNVNSKIK